MNVSEGPFEAVFLREESGRFRGWIEHLGIASLCYIPFSSKLSSHLPMEGRRILVRKAMSSEQLPYILEAVWSSSSWWLIDSRTIQKLLGKHLATEHRAETIYSERKLAQNYRADFVCESGQKQIWEAKCLLSEDIAITYPAMRQTRAERQFEVLERMMEAEWQVTLLFILINPSIRKLSINSKYPIFETRIRRLQRNGMIIRSLKLRENSGQYYFEKGILELS